MNIILTGFMGTGKTAVGKRLAKRLGWKFMDIDTLIEATTHESIARIFTEHGERVFRRLEKRCIRRVARGRDQIIATGGGAFVDPENQRTLRAIGPVLCLTASPKIILERVGSTLSRRPMLTNLPAAPGREDSVRAAQAGGPPLARIQQLLQQRASAYAKADLAIDTSRLTVGEVVEQIWSRLSPLMSRSWQYLLKHSPQLSHRYGGKYVVVLDDHIVAVGTTQLEAYQRIRQQVPTTREVGIYYIPLPEESAVAL